MTNLSSRSIVHAVRTHSFMRGTARHVKLNVSCANCEAQLEIKVLKSFTNTPREYLKKCPECDATLKFKINPQSDGVLWV